MDRGEDARGDAGSILASQPSWGSSLEESLRAEAGSRGLGALTKTAKSLGALVMLPVGDSAFGMCSRVKAVGRIVIDSLTTRYPWEPLNAQQFPG